MFKTYSPLDKIAFASIIISAIGFSLDFVSIQLPIFFIRVLIGLFQPVTFQWGATYQTPVFISINQFFYLLLFAGGVISFASKHKETLLIRFVFSLIFVSCTAFAITAIIDNVLSFVPSKQFWLATSQVALFTLERFLWAYAAFRVLEYFNKTKKLTHHEIVYGEARIIQYETASIAQRACHLVVDSFLMLLLFYWLYNSLLNNVATIRVLQVKLQAVTGKFVYLFLIVIYFRVVYYLMTECILGTTPAKLLTGTRVIDDEGFKPNAGRIIYRTAIRFIPFEAISVIGYSALHDKWSGTMVAREEQTGINSKWYLLIIPVYILVLVL